MKLLQDQYRAVEKSRRSVSCTLLDVRKDTTRSKSSGCARGSGGGGDVQMPLSRTFRNIWRIVWSWSGIMSGNGRIRGGSVHQRIPKA